MRPKFDKIWAWRKNNWKTAAKQDQHLAERTVLDAKEIIGKLENSIGIWPLALCLEASDKTRLWRGLFAPMDKRGKKRVHENTLFPTSILPKTVEKTTRNNATHDGNLELKKVPGKLGSTRRPTKSAEIGKTHCVLEFYDCAWKPQTCKPWKKLPEKTLLTTEILN